MMYLSDYMQEAQTALFKSTGAFFAFSPKQFNEAREEGVKYTSCGAGMICPSDNVDRLMTDLEKIGVKGIAQDMAENGKKAIIHRELANHEAQLTGDIDTTLEALAGYPITWDDVKAEYSEYYAFCVRNDYF